MKDLCHESWTPCMCGNYVEKVMYNEFVVFMPHTQNSNTRSEENRQSMSHNCLRLCILLWWGRSPFLLHLHSHLHFNIRDASVDVDAGELPTHWCKYQTRMKDLCHEPWTPCMCGNYVEKVMYNEFVVFLPHTQNSNTWSEENWQSPSHNCLRLCILLWWERSPFLLHLHLHLHFNIRDAGVDVDVDAGKPPACWRKYQTRMKDLCHESWTPCMCGNYAKNVMYNEFFVFVFKALTCCFFPRIS